MRSSACCRTASSGVYSPSPGTIYPRLARLEEEGLVTHDEIDGKKVYRITDKGREELHARLDDLAELEDEMTASVRDIAREVTEDVRETVRSLREELASAARDMNKTRPPGRARAGRRSRTRGGPGAGSVARAGRKTPGVRQATSGSRPRRPRMSPKTKRAPARAAVAAAAGVTGRGGQAARAGGRLRLGWLVRRGRTIRPQLP